MEEQLGRRRARQPEFHLDAVTLIGADPFPGFVEREALFIAGLNEIHQPLTAQGPPVILHARQQQIHRNPACLFKF